MKKKKKECWVGFIHEVWKQLVITNALFSFQGVPYKILPCYTNPSPKYLPFLFHYEHSNWMIKKSSHPSLRPSHDRPQPFSLKIVLVGTLPFGSLAETHTFWLWTKTSYPIEEAHAPFILYHLNNRYSICLEIQDYILWCSSGIIHLLKNLLYIHKFWDWNQQLFFSHFELTFWDFLLFYD